MSTSLPSLIAQELQAYRAARRSRDAARAWQALEDAHVLSQSSLVPHLRVHAAMLGYAVALRDWREASGQIARLALAPLGALTKQLPWGNTGRSSVSAFRPMPIRPELRAKLSAAGAWLPPVED